MKTAPKYSASLRLHDFKVLGLIDKVCSARIVHLESILVSSKVQLVQNKRTDDVYVIKVTESTDDF